jgi:hypothetical protein
MVPYLNPRLAQIHRAVRTSAALNKFASTAADQADREKAAMLKVLVDSEVFGMAHFSMASHVKTAVEKNPVVFSATAMANAAVGLYSMHKTAGFEDARLEEAVEKLAAVGTIEGMLNTLPSDTSAEAQKLAGEVRALNRAYGVHVLNELLK